MLSQLVTQGLCRLYRLQTPVPIIHSAIDKSSESWRYFRRPIRKRASSSGDNYFRFWRAAIRVLLFPAVGRYRSRQDTIVRARRNRKRKIMLLLFNDFKALCFMSVVLCYSPIIITAYLSTFQHWCESLDNSTITIHKLHRVHEKNCTPVYVAITLANNVGFLRNSTPTLRR